jgi:molecular chaperone DnaK
VAVIETVIPRVLANREGSRTTPSIIALSADGDVLVGEIAKRQALVNPDHTIFAVKRLIGRKFADPEVQRLRRAMPFSLLEAENGDIKLRLGERECTPEEISALLLREIRRFAEEELGEQVEKAVITVPAHFNDAQRQATRDAGRLAGLDVVRIINEPTGAALAHGLGRRQQGTVAVYDLGGGTFDVSILELNEGVFEVKATAGDPYLGGEDFDQRIVDWLVAEFQSEAEIDLSGDRMALQRLKEAAERAKCDLSMETEVEINLPFIAVSEAGPGHLNRTLKRETFESLVEDLIERTEAPCEEALEEAGLSTEEIDQVLVVGGQTRTPAVIATVERLFAQAPNKSINPDEAIAMGAAIQGGILSGDLDEVVLLDVTPLSLGVETHGGLFTRLIDRNSTIPTKVSQVFTTVADNQAKVEIHVLQGEREMAAQNKSLGRFDLVGIPPAPRGAPQVEVTFAIDSNGIVNVSARDRATNTSQGMEISPAGGLTSEEIERLVEEAEEKEGLDRERSEARRLANRLEGLLYTNERVFSQFEEVLSQKDRSAMRETLRKARRSLLDADLTSLESAINNVKLISVHLSELMINQMGAPDSGP